MKREALTSKRARTRKRKKTILWMIGSAVFFIVFVSTFAWLACLQSLQIENITITGAHPEFETLIRTEVDERLSRNMLFIFPKKNIYLFSIGSLKQWIRQHAHVKDVAISREGFNTVAIHVQEREPVALWCSGEPPHESNTGVGDCMFVDVTGYLFSQAPYFYDHVYFELFGTPTGENDTVRSVASSSAALSTTSDAFVAETGYLGTYFLPTDTFNNIMHFKLLLEDVGLPVHTLVLKSRERVEYIVYPRNTKIITTLYSEPVSTVNDVRTALDTKLEENSGVGVEDIEYIDARFSDKIVFRFR